MGTRLQIMAATGVLVAGVTVGTPPAEAAFPGPNGRIAFVSERDGNFEIYSTGRGGGRQVNLTNHPDADYTPAFSSDGTKIAFASERDGDAEIFIMNADGSDLTQITDNEFFDGDPAFSPDGRKLVVVRYKGGDNPDFLVIVNLTSGRERFLTKGFEPMWSPSGDQIAFDRVHGSGNIEVNTIRPDGTSRRRLTRSLEFDGSPNWSPDGARIAFTSERSGNSDIYVMAADGSDPTKVTSGPKADILPAWAPAGNRIAFTRVRDPDFTQTDIRTVRIVGGDIVRVTTAPGLDLDADWGVAS